MSFHFCTCLLDYPGGQFSAGLCLPCPKMHFYIHQPSIRLANLICGCFVLQIKPQCVKRALKFIFKQCCWWETFRVFTQCICSPFIFTQSESLVSLEVMAKLPKPPNSSWKHCNQALCSCEEQVCRIQPAEITFYSFIKHYGHLNEKQLH